MRRLTSVSAAILMATLCWYSIVYAGINACELLTREEATAILGQEVQIRAGSPHTMELAAGTIQAFSCWYDAVSSDDSVGLTITLKRDGSYPKTPAEFREMLAGKSKNTEIDVEYITGIGDLAIWGKTFGVGNLNVYLEPYKIAVMTGCTDKHKEAAKTLVKKIISKL